MATKSVTLRSVLNLIPDTGAEPECALDTSAIAPLLLSGFKEEQIRTLKLASADTDIAVAFTAPLVIVLFSDKPFRLRMAAAETLLANTRYFALFADDINDVVHPGASILLTGNGTDEALVRIVIVEKP